MRKSPLIGIIPVFLMVVSGGWISAGLNGEVLFEQWHPVFQQFQFLTIIVSTIIFVISVIWLYHYRKYFLAVRTLEQVQTRPHGVLIVFVSSSNPPVSGDFNDSIIVNGNSVTLTGDIEKDIQELKNYKWNWLQMLRALRPHKEKLKLIYLIGSSGRNGSFEQLDMVEKFFSRYFPNVIIKRYNNGLDFEDIEEMIDTLRNLIRTLKKEGNDEKDIIIDITGGQKTASIAGAVATLNSNIKFQYVQTREPYDVISYNVDIQSPVSL